MRLVEEGQSDPEGLLEVCIGETWCRVHWCDYWNSSEAGACAVCRQMGHSLFNPNTCTQLYTPRLVSRVSARSEPSSEEHVPNQLFYSVGTETKLNCSANVDQSRGQSNRVRIYFQPHCEF